MSDDAAPSKKQKRIPIWLVTFKEEDDDDFTEIEATPFESMAEATRRLMELAYAALWCLEMDKSPDVTMEHSMQAFWSTLNAAYTDSPPDFDWTALLPPDVRRQLARKPDFKTHSCGACIRQGLTLNWHRYEGDACWFLQTTADPLDKPHAPAL